jgi:hypothetical protein
MSSVHGLEGSDPSYGSGYSGGGGATGSSGDSGGGSQSDNDPLLAGSQRGPQYPGGDNPIFSKSKEELKQMLDDLKGDNSKEAKAKRRLINRAQKYLGSRHRGATRFIVTTVEGMREAMKDPLTPKNLIAIGRDAVLITVAGTVFLVWAASGAGS